MTILNNYKFAPFENEKRNFIRMQIEVPIQLTNQTTNEVFTGLGKNLSANGIMFAANTNFPLETQLLCTIFSQHHSFNNFNATIQIVHTKLDPKTKLFTVGAKIINYL